jgi:hypothetical protein
MSNESILVAALSGPHLLYISGDDLDHEAIQTVVNELPHFVLGPFCWVVKPPSSQERTIFADKLQAVLPAPPSKHEFLFCPLLSNARFLRTSQGGLGLKDWLKKHENIS